MSLHISVSGQGPNLILLHGWAMHSGIFAPLMPGLNRHFRVHCVDLPGHGGSAPLPQYSVGALAAAVAATLEPDRSYRLIGHSLGACAAVESVAAIVALRERVVPATLNTRRLDPALPRCTLALEPMISRAPAVLLLAESFGGRCAAWTIRAA